MRREDFPPLRKTDLTYLDSACMSLRPDPVIDAVETYYREYPACPGRSHHSMSEKASDELIKSREKIADFVGADSENLMLTSGTTEGLNTVARGFDTQKVFLSDREHNSNLAPWQRKNCETVFLETENGLDIESLRSNVSEGNLVSLVHISNLDGMEFRIEEVAQIAREQGAYTLVDAAQSAPHMPLDVSEMPVDFLAFSGHKMLGPSGTGGLYVSERTQNKLEPLNTGGGAVEDTTQFTRERRDFPYGFEAGLPNVAGFIGLGKAASYLSDIGMGKVESHEHKLTEKLEQGFSDIEEVSYISNGPGVVTFWVDGMDAHQVALMLDRKDIAVRSGKHCVHSWFDQKDVRPGVRVSLHLYNNDEDIREIVEEVKKISYVA
ncbi:MAG: selenocysteine lyase [Candidatus Nanosalina sp. J07AB43]|nr:MAG: selenocysteine lyase [Candidatus Nanosalina sp. J07AB43]